MVSTWVPDVLPDSPFSLANIPFGIISTSDDPAPHGATAIGSHVLDLKVLCSDATVARLLSSSPRPPPPPPPPADEAFDDVPAPDYAAIFSQPTLNAFAALGRPAHRLVRAALQDLLSAETRHPGALRDNAELRGRALIRNNSSDVTMHLPMSIGDYTDFYAGYHHARAVGTMFRGAQNALQPNYTHLPVGYHGRASSVVVSGTAVRRPRGQILLDGDRPTTAPSRRLDFELELGCLVATPNALGDPVAVDDAEAHIFGYVLLNDWSARDVQTWEYVPLGPFNSKNFASTVSPWVVLADALEPFRTRPVENATPLQDYLKEGRKDSVFDIELEVDLETPSGDVTTISTSNSEYLLWSFPQMIAHHTLGGCPMRTGDLLGSGTISGPGPNQSGSLLEMSDGGKKDVLLYGMDVRRFLRDGDTVTIRGSCGKPGERVGFGNCVGRILPPK